MASIRFIFHTGLRRPLSPSARLTGSWDQAGRPSENWTSVAMSPTRDDAGCPAFEAVVDFPDDVIGTTFRWGVILDGPGGREQWGIPTEVQRYDSREQTRSFALRPGSSTEEYFLTNLRRLGANKFYPPGASQPGIRFALWAPNARAVELVFLDPRVGYVADQPDAARNGAGAISTPGQFPLRNEANSGVWSIDSTSHPALGSFAERDHGPPYMWKVTRDDGSVVYRTDLYSRCQVGRGKIDPRGAAYSGLPDDLDGTKSGSVVIDPERVCRLFDEPYPQQQWQTADEFWADEFNPARPVPTAIEDLVIYELHVPGLGFGRPDPGKLGDAIALLDHLAQLGVTAVELLPMAEAEGWASWGYGTSHYHAVEYVSGGRDQFKHFVKACHQRGLAVILDVVYNHYTLDSERAQWAFDSPDPTRNIYYWYEGRPEDYPRFQAAVSPERRNDGGYVSNESSGWAPRFWEEQVRRLFISSAVALAEEFHVDGFRVDQTTSIHAYPHLVADGRPAESARSFGIKFLREWCRTVRLVKPQAMLFAEDHSQWPAVVESTDSGGLGFDAVWYADFYHHLAGDTGRGANYANLLREAAQGDGRPLALDQFAGALARTSRSTVVYHESHDEAGNSRGSGWESGRTIVVAVNRAPLFGETRRYAEARSRVIATLNLLSAGVPMFFMGEEVGFERPYRYNDFLDNREDFLELRRTHGDRLYSYYQDLLRKRREVEALRGGGIEVIYTHASNRVLAFRRWRNGAECLVVTSLADQPFADGYDLESNLLPDRPWREILNSDAASYGGWNIGNFGTTINSRAGRMRLRLPASGAIVFAAS